MTISLDDQADEAELHYRGLRDLHARAAANKFKRNAHETERLEMRRDVAEATVFTLRDLAYREKALAKKTRTEDAA